MKNSRRKGLEWVRIVRKMLEGMGHIVEGPFYKPVYLFSGMRAVHFDIFKIADLISYSENQFILHQVTDVKNKSSHVKLIQEKNLPCWIWCKIEGKIAFRIFFVDKGKIEEGEAKFWKK